MKKVAEQTTEELSQFFDELEFVESSLHNSLSLKGYFDNPRVPFPEKVETFKKIFKAHINPATYDFICVLLRSNTVDLLSKILRNYRQVRPETGILELEVITSVPLRPEEKSALLERLAKKFGKPITIKSVVDPKIIGGLVIKAGDMMIDASIDKKMKKLMNHLRQRG